MMRTVLLTLLACATGAKANILWSDVCTQSDVKSQKFCDTSASIDDRAAAFVSALQLEEKAGIMVNNGKGVDRFHIPPYQWGSEGLHGPLQPCVPAADGSIKCPTSFPAPCAMASAFNDTMYHEVGAADGLEARAINNLRNHQTQNVYGDGIDYWSPTVNMQRDPRWGRNQEVPGEDPMLTGQYAVNFLQGIQYGKDPKHTQIVGTCKHFVANSMENWYNYSRHNYDAKVSKADLADYYFPAFKACVMEGKAMSIMCSYNAVNGIPMCANAGMLNDTLRNSWKFTGYVTSDCGAVQNVWTPEPQGHGYTDKVRATAISVIAGTDIDCGSQYSSEFGAAVEAGELTEAAIDVALTRLTKAWLRLGLFDPKADQPYFQLGGDVIDSPAHQALALEAAQQAVVLLKNEGNVLPLKPGGKVAVVGPHFNVSEVMISNYHGSRCPKGFDCIPTPFDMIKTANAGGTTVGVQGCEVDSTKDDIAAAVAAAKESDTVVMVMGIGQGQEREGQDRYNTTLPGLQIQLAEEILKLGKPTILVLIHGGAMSLGHLKEEYPAIVDAFYGGEMGGVAIADVLFGKYNPSGKLAVTMYPPDFVLKVPLNDMSVTTPPGRTHMYYTGEAEFTFGTGLSYSTIALEMASKAASTVDVTSGASDLDYSVNLRHVSGPPGKQTVLAFWKPRNPKTTPGQVPLKQKLFGYANAFLTEGMETTLRFTLNTDKLAVANEDGHKIIESGLDYDIIFTDGNGLEVGGALRTSGEGIRVVEAYPMA